MSPALNGSSAIRHLKHSNALRNMRQNNLWFLHGTATYTEYACTIYIYKHIDRFLFSLQVWGECSETLLSIRLYKETELLFEKTSYKQMVKCVEVYVRQHNRMTLHRWQSHYWPMYSNLWCNSRHLTSTYFNWPLYLVAIWVVRCYWDVWQGHENYWLSIHEWNRLKLNLT